VLRAVQNFESALEKIGVKKDIRNRQGLFALNLGNMPQHMMLSNSHNNFTLHPNFIKLLEMVSIAF